MTGLRSNNSPLVETAAAAHQLPIPLKAAMTTYLLLDEIHIEVRVSRTMPRRDLAAVRRALAARAFLPRLGRAIRPIFTGHPALAAVRFRVTR
jgi:hypothetical protein